jgi:hypothetical protein
MHARHEDELALLDGLVGYVVHCGSCGMPMFSRENRFKDKGIAWAAT